MKILELIKSAVKKGNGLTKKVSIYIPSTIDVNKEIDTSQYIDECAILLSEMFGGATSQQVNGYWNSDTHGLVKENITIVYAFHNKMSSEQYKDIIAYCTKLRTELSQEAISLEINGRLIFIDQ